MARKSEMDFKTAFCMKYHCSSDDFNTQIFKICSLNRVKATANIINLLRPEFFAYDWELIEKISRATNQRQVQEAISNYYLLCGYKRSILHDRLHFRISCSSLQKLAYELFETEESPQPSPDVRHEDSGSP